MKTRLPLTDKGIRLCERCKVIEFEHLVDTRINGVVVKIDKLCKNCYEKEANGEHV
jgi:hypothetical protein